MPSQFRGFPLQAMAFFRELKRHNNREWFESHKLVYNEMVKLPMHQLVEALNKSLLRFAPEHVTDPGKAVYRIYRDIRFGADKTPYKTHIAANFPNRRLDKHSGAGFYFSVSPGGIDVAGGVYMPGAEQLLAIRKHIANNNKEFYRIVKARKLCSVMGDLQGEQLIRPPKGFPKDHPAIDYLRFKQLYFYVVFDPDMATTPEIRPELVKRFRVMMPLIEFLNRPLLEREQKTRPGWLFTQRASSSRRSGS